MDYEGREGEARGEEGGDSREGSREGSREERMKEERRRRGEKEENRARKGLRGDEEEGRKEEGRRDKGEKRRGGKRGRKEEGRKREVRKGRSEEGKSREKEEGNKGCHKVRILRLCRILHAYVQDIPQEDGTKAHSEEGTTLAQISSLPCRKTKSINLYHTHNFPSLHTHSPDWLLFCRDKHIMKEKQSANFPDTLREFHHQTLLY